MLRNIYAIVCALCVTLAIAQKKPVKFGDIPPADLKMSYSSIDSTAGAEYLLDWGKMSYNNRLQIEFETHVRIKILNKNELDRGDVIISYAEGDRVTKIKAATYNLENGRMVPSELSKKDIFDEEVTDGYRRKRFSLPNLRVGSVIEYTYTVQYQGWQSLNAWYFQTSIPVRYSHYIVSVPEFFQYNQIMTGYVQLADYKASQQNFMYGQTNIVMDVKEFIAKNVPPFKDEPYMTTSKDYISKIKFELAQIDIPGEYYKTLLPPTYEALSKSLAEKEYYSSDIINNKYLQEKAYEVIAGATTDEEKIQKLYEYVRDEFEYDEEAKNDRIRATFMDGKGSGNSINRLLAAMLNEVGIRSELALLSTRSHGKLHPTYPMLSNFNYMVVCARVDGKDILMDPGVGDLPFGMLPLKCLNGQAMPVSSYFRWVPLSSPASDFTYHTGQFDIDEDGIVSGKLQVVRRGYNAHSFRNKYDEDPEEYVDNFASRHDTWIIDQHEVSGLEDCEENIKHNLEIEIEDQAELLDDLVLFNPMIEGRVNENPFEIEQRLFPVDFGTTQQQVVNYQFKLPTNMVVDELPQPLHVALPNRAGSYIYQVKQLGDQIMLTAKLSITKPEFIAEEYPYLREFYSQMVAKQAESIVLKIENK